MHATSMQAMEAFVAAHLADRRGRPLRVLDLGSMDVNGSYRTVLSDPSWEYTGVDMSPGPGVDVVLRKPYDWSGIASQHFDVVVSGQAFEHIEFPWVTMLEVARVLRPGGITCIIVPSGGPEHRYPVDCWRYYPDGVKALARWADLDVVSAVTHWDDVKADDGSGEWHDTVLVAKKGSVTGFRGIRNRVKLGALRRLMAVQASRRVGDDVTSGTFPD